MSTELGAGDFHQVEAWFARGDRSTAGFTDFRTRIDVLGGFSPPA
jgi:hypothetical protein